LIFFNCIILRSKAKIFVEVLAFAVRQKSEFTTLDFSFKKAIKCRIQLIYNLFELNKDTDLT